MIKRIRITRHNPPLQDTPLPVRLERYLSTLPTTQGYRQGLPLLLFAWQKQFIRGTFQHESGDAALSVSRGAGKTTLVAAIAAAAINGPLVNLRGETVIVGPSLNQSRISFRHVQAFLRTHLQDTKRFRVWDSTQHSLIEDRITGATLRCLSCEPSHLHGIAPSLLILDEGAQWPTNLSEEAFSTLKTSLGKCDGSRLIALGTRPLASNTDHWFNDLLKSADYSQVHEADKTDPPFQRKTWEKANPSLKGGHMPSLLRQYRDEAARAKKNPGMLAGFKALRLNLGTSPTIQNNVLPVEEWENSIADVERTGPYILALDLGDGAAMSAAAGFWPQSGRLEGIAAFPAVPDLKTRGLKDGVGGLYIKCHERGELFTTPGRAVDVKWLLGRALSSWGRPIAVVCDRYRESDLRQALDGANFPQSSLILRGQGFKDGAEDVRQFRRAHAEGKVKPVQSLLMSAAFAEAMTVSDPSANEKLAKSSQGGRRRLARDDVAAAAILAVAEGIRRAPQMSSKPRLRYAVCGVSQ